MKDKGKSIAVDMEEDKEEDSDEQWSDEETSDSREIVLGLPALSVSYDEEEEEEVRLNEQGVTAAELVMAAVEKAVTQGKKKKRTPRKIRSLHEITSISRNQKNKPVCTTSATGVEEEACLNEQAVVAAQLVMAAASEAAMKEKGDGKKKMSGTRIPKNPKKKALELSNPPIRPLVCNTTTTSVAEEEEARLNEKAVIAAELLLAAAEEAEKNEGNKKKSKMRSDSSPRGEAKKAKKKGPELSHPPEGPPVCNICGKGFGSWKAVFGHLRSHKDRNYQGFLPPPTFSASSVPEKLAIPGPNSGFSVPEKFAIPGPNSAFRLVAVGGGSSVGLATGGGRINNVPTRGDDEALRGSEIDLNVHPMEEVDESESVAKFDLNKSPPNEDEDE